MTKFDELKKAVADILDLHRRDIEGGDLTFTIQINLGRKQPRILWKQEQEHDLPNLEA